MVPPVYIPGEPEPEISRIGLQQTYAFFADGVETLAIRPGFTGSVDEFGMLVPFPSAPAIRKIDDRTFDHLAAAVDPPEVDLYFSLPAGRSYMSAASLAPGVTGNQAAPTGLSLRRDEVRVLDEEAVGMYEVAVLAAGSPRALRKWMESRAFRYPEGMERVVEDYVRSGWVFVAIKARVGSTGGTDARPGMRDVDPRLPQGSRFDGHVQGMGFRFEVDQPVIPMRLSTFNGDDLHNRVYLLTETPVKIQGVDATLVRRQVTGSDLYRNLVTPLEINVHANFLQLLWRARLEGQSLSYENLTGAWKERVDELRDPERYNGVARALIASDLLAAGSETLSLPFEEREKALLRISEALDLRGPEVDQLHMDEASDERRETLEGSLSQVRDFTLTVIDGDLPRGLLAEENLRIEPYSMSADLNNPVTWNVQPVGPQVRAPSGAWMISK